MWYNFIQQIRSFCLDKNTLGGIGIKKYIYNNYNIYIKEAPPYSFNSVDNKPYSKVLVIEETDFNKSIEVEIEKCGEIRTVLMVVPYYTPLKSFVAPHKDGLFMMMNDVLCVFEPETASITKQTRISPMGTMFEVYQIDDDYILYGEMEIYRISKDLTLKWEFSGRDIFVRYQGDEPAFIMKKDRICLYDFEDNYYEINFEGKLLI